MSSQALPTMQRAELPYVDRFRRSRREAIERRLGRDSSMHPYAAAEGFDAQEYESLAE